MQSRGFVKLSFFSLRKTQNQVMWSGNVEITVDQIQAIWKCSSALERLCRYFYTNVIDFADWMPEMSH